MGEKPNYILIVDGNNLVARNVHANSTLAARNGKRTIFTGGLYGSLSSLKSVLWHDLYRQVAGVVVIHDRGRPKYRTKLCPEYKANRTPIDTLRRRVERGKATKKEKQEYEMLRKMLDQNERLPDFLAPLGVATIISPGWEADDVAAYLALRVFTEKRFPNLKVMLFSGDGDWTQLVGNHVHQKMPGKNDRIVKKTRPYDRILKVLEGDPADNLKGVVGVGRTRAEQLIAEIKRKPSTPEELRKAIKKSGIPLDKGPAKAILEQWDSFVAQFKATDMPRAVRKMEKLGARFKLTFTGIDKKVFRKNCRRLQMRSFLYDEGETISIFGSAFTKGRMAGVFDALEELA